MMFEAAVAVAVGGGLAAAIGGYLLGVRTGAGARARLEQRMRLKEEDLRQSRTQLRAVLQLMQARRYPPTPGAHRVTDVDNLYTFTKFNGLAAFPVISR